MVRDFNTPPLPLVAITLHPRHHSAALWWLGWLYRNPDAFKASLNQLLSLPSVHVAMVLYLHALPWFLLLTFASKMLLFCAGLTHHEWAMLPVVQRLLVASSETVFGLSGLVGFSFIVGLIVGIVTDQDCDHSTSFGLIVGFIGGAAVGFIVDRDLVVSIIDDLVVSINYYYVFHLAIGLVVGFVVGFFFSISDNLVFGLVFCLVFGLAGCLGGDLVVILSGLVLSDLVLSAVFVLGLVVGFISVFILVLVFGLILGLRGVLFVGFVVGFVLVVGLSGVLGSGLVLSLAVGLGGFIGVQLGYYRLYYLCLHALFWLFRRQPKLYRFHPAAWDWLCWTPFPWFDRLLVNYVEADSVRMEPETQLRIRNVSGQRSAESGIPNLLWPEKLTRRWKKFIEADSVRMEPEIRRLINEVPGQRPAALRAFTILHARSAARLSVLTQLTEILASLPEGKDGYLAETRRVRELGEAISRQQLRVNSTNRTFFRDIEARSLVTEVRNFQHRISGFHEPLATEFSKAADTWLKLAEAQVALATAAAKAEPAPLVFRAGPPVIGAKEAFVPRFRVLEELEGQIMLGGGCPGMLLRSPRRMGKSSLLKNVTGFLPKEVIVTYMSLQSARLFSSTGHFVGGVAKAVEASLPALAELGSVKQNARLKPPEDLASFLHFLSDCNTALECIGWRLLLALDEYEMLDGKLEEGVFTSDLLATLRESIQSHRQIIWAFSGNADITELTGADWTSYLISVHTLEVPLFTQDETHLLLTEPLNYSALPEKDKAQWALFWREFWGEGGIIRIHTESGGWPYFVQLIAETAVMLTNESISSTKPLSKAMLDSALNESVLRGRNAFHQLLRSQCRVPGEWEYLLEFVHRESQQPPADDEVRRLLKRRQILMETPRGEWRLIVPLMARWLRKEW